MRVRDLIERLLALPQEANVYRLYDGYSCDSVDHVYVSRSGGVVIAGGDEAICSEPVIPVDESLGCWDKDTFILAKQKTLCRLES